MADTRAACDVCSGYEDETLKQFREIPEDMHLCPGCYMDYMNIDPDYYEEWVIADV